MSASSTSLLPDVGVDLREGYAAVGDQTLHYVEAADWAPTRTCRRRPGGPTTRGAFADLAIRVFDRVRGTDRPLR